MGGGPTTRFDLNLCSYDSIGTRANPRASQGISAAWEHRARYAYLKGETKRARQRGRRERDGTQKEKLSIIAHGFEMTPGR